MKKALRHFCAECWEAVEARAGVEPTYTDLQSGA